MTSAAKRPAWTRARSLKMKGFHIGNTSYGNQVKALKTSCKRVTMTLELSADLMLQLATPLPYTLMSVVEALVGAI